MRRFWDKVAQGAPADCWEWQRSRCSDGYGRFSWRGAPDYSHRVAWQLTNGPIPDGMLVCHRCDNPPCVNPAHLFLGTHADNVRDMQTKGRAKRAVRKFDHALAASLVQQGLSQRKAARLLGVSQPALCVALQRLSDNLSRVTLTASRV